MTSSVDGLVSGLSTSSLISQLMTVEKAPQDRLKSKVTSTQTVVKSYLSVNAQLTALNTASDNLGLLSTWRGITATSSSATVTATAVSGTNGAAGVTTFNVKDLAKSQITAARVSSSADIVDSGVDTITVTIGNGSFEADGVTSKDKTVQINVSADRTAAGVAKAINSAGIGVKAALVTASGTDKVLQLSGSKTGAENAFTVSGLTGSVTLANVATAQNARLEVGGGDLHSADGGYDVISSTNTFTDLLPGVTTTVSKVEDDVTISATSDIDGIAAKFQAVVDAANAALDEVSKQTAYDSSTNKGSPLSGDFAVRNLSQILLSTISKGLTIDDPSSNTTPKAKLTMSMSSFGVQLDKDNPGRLLFSAEKFKKAYSDNPATIQAAGVAFADSFEDLSKKQSNNISSVITGRKTEIATLNTQIDNWDVRLASKQLALQKRYSDLEVSLGKLKDQSTWLSGQLAGLG